MAIQIHNWENKSGTCVIKQKDREFTLNLYGYCTSNCYLVAVYEYKDTETSETMEQLQWFFMDESHAKIMLGLKKGSDGKKENYMDEIRKLTLYKSKLTEWKKILLMFAEAFPKIDIEIREDE